MIKTYIIKIQSRNLTHDHRLLAVSFQMILKNKVKTDPSSGSNFLSLNRDRDLLQKYWAIVIKIPKSHSLNIPLENQTY